MIWEVLRETRFRENYFSKRMTEINFVASSSWLRARQNIFLTELKVHSKTLTRCGHVTDSQPLLSRQGAVTHSFRQHSRSLWIRTPLQLYLRGIRPTQPGKFGKTTQYQSLTCQYPETFKNFWMNIQMSSTTLR